MDGANLQRVPYFMAWREAGQGLGGGCKGFGSGGVSGRGTDPRNGANFATCVVFLSFLTRTKRRKIAFFEGCPVGWGGGNPPELAWWTGGLAWRGKAGWVPTKPGLVDGGSGRPGQGLGGGCKGFGSRGGRW